MANLRDIRRRIQSVRNTQKITRAMKMVAAAKLRRAQEAIVRVRPYAFRMRNLVNSLAARAESDSHPLLSPRDGRRVSLIVVTADRGLCGGFNSGIANETMVRLSGDLAEKEVRLTVIGRKGVELLKRRSCTVGSTFLGVFDRPLFEVSREIIDAEVERFKNDEIDEVVCLYNEFKSAIAQNVTFERLLPFEVDEETASGAVDYVYEPSNTAVFEGLLTRHMSVQMHRILLESQASENGARMTAMDAATTNAGEFIDSLTLKYNRARQDTITKELIEVVSGAEAL